MKKHSGSEYRPLKKQKMSNQIKIITSPDDSLEDSNRMLLVDLTTEQSQIVSETLSRLDQFSDIIIYVWKNGDDLDWLFDKKHKSKFIIFNADSLNQTLIGYFSAQPDSYYFGTLKDLNRVNKSVIYDIDQCFTAVTKFIS
jgi:hypothetical protein